VYRGELGDVVYGFTWSRTRDGPLKMLAGDRGYLQVDAAPAYDDVIAQHPEIIEVGCLAHMRRYFKEARPIVLGRKNYLFAGSEAAAHRTAILCSLVQTWTCKHLQINPFVYLRDVIERVSTHPARLVLELTPREWTRLRKDSATKAAA
jgi:hypothetical protein